MTPTPWSCRPPSGRTTPSWSRRARRGLRVLRRAEALAALMAGRRGIAVAGTHGKTTTTSMLTVALQALRRGPVVRDRRRAQRVGHQRPRGLGRHLRRRGRRERRLVPAAGPRGAIVTNVEADHLDHYGHRRGGRGRRSTSSRRDRGSRRLPRRLRRRPGRGAALVVTGARRGCRRPDLRPLRRRRPTASSRPVRANVAAASTSSPGRPARRHRAGGARSRTTCSTRPPHWPPASGWATRPRTCGTGSPPSAGPGAGSTSAAAPTGSGSTTTTRTTRPRSRPSCAPLRERRRRRAAGRRVPAAPLQPDRAVRDGVRRSAGPRRRGRRARGVRAGGGPDARRVRACRWRERPAAPGPGGLRAVLEPGRPPSSPSRARPGDVVLTLGAGDVTMIGPEVLELLRARETARGA